MFYCLYIYIACITGSEHFAVLVAGQLVSSFGALMLVSVTFFSEVWFSHRERATSTAFSAVIGPSVSTKKMVRCIYFLPSMILDSMVLDSSFSNLHLCDIILSWYSLDLSIIWISYYRSISGKRPCTKFEGVNENATVLMHAIFLPGTDLCRLVEDKQ